MLNQYNTFNVNFFYQLIIWWKLNILESWNRKSLKQLINRIFSENTVPGFLGWMGKHDTVMVVKLLQIQDRIFYVPDNFSLTCLKISICPWPLLKFPDFSLTTGRPGAYQNVICHEWQSCCVPVPQCHVSIRSLQSTQSVCVHFWIGVYMYVAMSAKSVVMDGGINNLSLNPELVVIGSMRCCHNNNFCCHQWWQTQGRGYWSFIC